MRKGLDMNHERCGIWSAYEVLGYAQSELVCMTCCLEMKSICSCSEWPERGFLQLFHHPTSTSKGATYWWPNIEANKKLIVLDQIISLMN